MPTRVITKIKQFAKTSQGSTVNHVIIQYQEGNATVTLHEYERAAPEFYKLFADLSEHVNTICEFNTHEAERLTVEGVSLTFKEEENGDEKMGTVFTAKRKLFNSRNGLTINTPLKWDEHKDPHQKLSQEAFATVEALTVEADEYIEGKREQVDHQKNADEIQKAEAEAEESRQNQEAVDELSDTDIDGVIEDETNEAQED